MKSLPRPLGLATLLLAASGCMPSGIFSTARTLPPGEVEHAAFAELGGTLYAATGSERRGDFRRGVENVAPMPGYAVRGGVTRRIEIGGHLAGSAVEANGKLGLLDGDKVAISLAPRVAASWFPGDPAETTLVHTRLPVLFTYEPTRWFSITPRAGLGIARGRVASHGYGAPDTTALVSSPFGEAGLNLLFQVAPWLGLSFEGYATRSLGNLGGRDFEGGGVGMALVFGPRR